MTFSVRPNKNNLFGFLARGLCVCCGKEANSFGDHNAKKHYERTGLCQECQRIKYEHTGTRKTYNNNNE